MLITASAEEVKQLSMWNHRLLCLPRSQGQEAQHRMHSLAVHMRTLPKVKVRDGFSKTLDLIKAMRNHSIYI